MKVELFTLCDGAYNYNGKLTIVGTLDGINVHALPSQVNFGIALKLRQEEIDTGDRKLSLHFVEPNGVEIPAEISMNLALSEHQKDSHISAAVNIQGLPLKNEGEYNIKVNLDQITIGEYRFFVNTK